MSVTDDEKSMVGSIWMSSFWGEGHDFYDFVRNNDSLNLLKK